MVTIVPPSPDDSGTPRCQNGIHRTLACPTCGEALGVAHPSPTSPGLGGAACFDCGYIEAAGTRYVIEPCDVHAPTPVEPQRVEQRPDTDPLIRAAAAAIRRVAIAEYDDTDDMVVIEGYPFNLARAVMTTLSDLVAFIPEAVALFDNLPEHVKEAAIRSVRSGRCDSCYATGFRVTFSPEHAAYFCDGCYQRESGHECGRPMDPNCDGCRAAWGDAFGGPTPTLPDPIRITGRGY